MNWLVWIHPICCSLPFECSSLFKAHVTVYYLKRLHGPTIIYSHNCMGQETPHCAAHNRMLIWVYNSIQPAESRHIHLNFALQLCALTWAVGKKNFAIILRGFYLFNKIKLIIITFIITKHTVSLQSATNFHQLLQQDASPLSCSAAQLYHVRLDVI